MSIQDDIAAFNASKNAPKDINADIAAFKSQGQYSELSQPIGEVPESAFRPATAEDLPKETPSFLKAVDMIGSGAMKGSLEFTGRLMSFAEKGLTGTDYVQRAIDYWDQKNKEDASKYSGAGFLQGVGSVPMELVSTAPLGPILGATGKAATVAGKVAPAGLKKLAEYGVSGGLGGAALAGLEGLRSETSDKPTAGLPVNVAGVEAALGSPTTYAAPMAGTLLTNWAQKAQRLEEAKQIIPGITNRQLDTIPTSIEGISQPSTGSYWKSVFLDSFPNMVGMGKSIRTQESAGQDIANYIKTLSANVSSGFAKDYRAEAGKAFQRTLKGMEAKENDLWKASDMLSKPVADPEDVKTTLTYALDVMNKNGIETEKTVRNLINETLAKKSLSVGDIKDMRTILSSAQYDLKGSGRVGSLVSNQLDEFNNKLLSSIEDSLKSSAPNPLMKEKLLKDYNAATNYSARLFDFKKESPKIQDALYDQVDANNIVKKVVSEAETLNKGKILGEMSEADRRTIWASKLANALESSGYPNSRVVDLDKFTKLTGPQSNLPELMGDSYKAIAGLNNYLRGIQGTGEQKMSKFMGFGAATAATGAIASGMALPVAAAAATYGALSVIANSSPLKKTFSVLSKGAEKLSPSVYQYLSDRANQLLTRSGFFMSDEGALDYSPKTKGNK